MIAVVVSVAAIAAPDENEGGDIGIDTLAKSGSRSWMVGPQRACRRWRMKRKAARKMSGVSAAMMIHIKGVLYSNQNVSYRNRVLEGAGKYG